LHNSQLATRNSQLHPLPRVEILGVRVHDCDEDGAVGAIEEFLSERAPGVRQVVTVNPEFIIEARRNPAFRELLNTADLATPDGVGIILAARLLGARLRGRATGVGIVNRLGALSARHGHGIFLLGAGPGVGEKAARELERRYPGVRIAGTYAGSPHERDFEDIRARLEAARPNVLLVAYGAPAQDIWIRRNGEALPGSIKVAMGVGGVFDYLSGRVPLAPATWRRAGLEWLYRLVKQPWRWRRILRVFFFGALVVRKAISGRKRAL
jgi:N-acetylglucosaminyldiphosphoundecaprenol N-acetyl-beta-D-mannosaminyltransferase